ncbi:MAG: hypothetical protein ACSHWU_09360 [Marinicella sp.]
MNRHLSRIGWLLISGLSQVNAGTGSGEGDFISVGPLSAGDCDYTIIQEAIDQETFDIHVVTGIYDENISLTDQARDLVGGFADCEAAEDNTRVVGSQSTIQPSSGHAMQISSNNEGGNDFVSLTGFEIVQGEAAGFIPAGGITVFGDVDLAIFESRIADNVGQLGGGIFVQEPATLYVRDSQIENNTAFDGGGIYCIGCNLTLNSGAGIFNNHAIGLEESFEGNGGGLHISSNAQVLLFNGSSTPASDHLGIHQNAALEKGGGIYIRESELMAYGNDFFGFGDNTSPVNITANNAYSGGGMYAEFDVIINATAIDVSNNTAAYSGAGMRINFDSILNVHAEDLFADEICWNTNKQQCNRFLGNQIIDNELVNHYGAAIVSALSEINISNTWFEGNHLSDSNGRGTVIFSEADKVFIQNSVMYANNDVAGEDQNVIDTFFTDFEMNQSTLVDNDINQAVVRVWDVDEDDFIIQNSIIHNQGDDLTVLLEGDGNEFLSFNCMVVHEQLSFTGLGSVINVAQADPHFFDRSAGDFNLYSESVAAIDRCQPVGLPIPTYDLNLTQRDVDVVGMGNDESAFTVDIGAIEYQGSDDLLDVIFKTSFEPIF